MDDDLQDNILRDDLRDTILRRGGLRDRETNRFVVTSGSSFERIAERQMIAAERQHCECPVCGREFAAPRIDAVYCSNACRQKAYRRRKTT